MELLEGRFRVTGAQRQFQPGGPPFQRLGVVTNVAVLDAGLVQVEPSLPVGEVLVDGPGVDVVEGDPLQNVAWRCLNTGGTPLQRVDGAGNASEGSMGKGAGQSRRSAEQRELRRRRGERAFVFDKDVSRCLAEFEREEWEWALSSLRR